MHLFVSLNDIFQVKKKETHNLINWCEMKGHKITCFDRNVSIMW
jgi:hypothetical protein